MSHAITSHSLPEPDAAWEHAGRAHARQLAELAARRPLQWSKEAEQQPIQRVGICGAGIMGRGIAAANVQYRIPIRIYDAAPPAVERTIEFLQRECPGVLRSDRTTDPAARQLVSICHSQDELADCDLVIESVVENRELKQQILCQLASSIGPRAILGTNTSTISLSALSANLPGAERFCGLHFCNPVPQRRLVEIVRGSRTSAATVAAAVHYVVRIGKLPVVVEDSPGFLVNRLLLPYLNEALELVCQGADLAGLDAAARDFGMAMGPIELFDMIGTDTAMWAGRTLWEAFPDRIALTPVLPALVKRNRLGRKVGVGFYRYDDPAAAGTADRDLAPILAPYLRRTRKFSQDELTLRLFLPMLVEATRVLEDKIVGDVRDVDVGLLYGLAFPESRGGLLYWADSLGAATIVKYLAPFEPLGKRMEPTALLRRMARDGQRFYDLVP